MTTPGWRIIIADSGAAHLRFIDSQGDAALYSPVYRDQEQARVVLQEVVEAVCDADEAAGAFVTYEDHRDPIPTETTGRVFPTAPSEPPKPLIQDPVQPITDKDREVRDRPHTELRFQK